MEKEEFDFERFKEEAMKGLYEGKKWVVPMEFLPQCLNIFWKACLKENWIIIYRKVNLPARLIVKMAGPKRRYGAFRPDISNWRTVVTEMAHSNLR